MAPDRARVAHVAGRLCMKLESPGKGAHGAEVSTG